MEFDRLDQSFIDQQVSITRQRASVATGLESEEVTAVSVAKQSGERIPQKTQVLNRNQDTSKGKVGYKGKNFSDTLAGLLAAYHRSGKQSLIALSKLRKVVIV